MEKTVFIETKETGDVLKVRAEEHGVYLTFYNHRGFQEYPLLPEQAALLRDILNEFLFQASMSGNYGDWCDHNRYPNDIPFIEPLDKYDEPR